MQKTSIHASDMDECVYLQHVNIQCNWYCQCLQANMI